MDLTPFHEALRRSRGLAVASAEGLDPSTGLETKAAPYGAAGPESRLF